MYKTVEIICFAKMFYVTAFGFVVFFEKLRSAMNYILFFTCFVLPLCGDLRTVGARTAAARSSVRSSSQLL